MDHLLEEVVVLLLPVVLILFLQWAVVLLPEVPILFLPWEERRLKLLLLLILHLPHNSNLLQLRHLEHHLPVSAVVLLLLPLEIVVVLLVPPVMLALDIHPHTCPPTASTVQMAFTRAVPTSICRKNMVT